MNLFRKIKTFSASFKLKLKYFYESKLTSKKHLALFFFLAYTPYFVYESYQHPDETTLLITKAASRISQIPIPKFARSFIFGAYSRYYKVNKQQMLEQLTEYSTFSEFFTRRIKQRKVAVEPFHVASPCDGRVLSFSEISSDSCFAVKGYTYSLGHLLCGQEIAFSQEDIDNIKKKAENKLYQVILYLAPGDYHRFHAPLHFQVTRRKQIQGFLHPVQEGSLLKNSKVYEKNARLILHGKWDQGYLAMVLVGALNVGRIVVKDKLNFQKGEEMGYFNLGSTIVLIIEASSVQWRIQQKQKVKYGQILCKTSVPTRISNKN